MGERSGAQVHRFAFADQIRHRLERYAFRAEDRVFAVVAAEQGPAGDSLLSLLGRDVGRVKLEIDEDPYRADRVAHGEELCLGP